MMKKTLLVLMCGWSAAAGAAVTCENLTVTDKETGKFIDYVVRVRESQSGREKVFSFENDIAYARQAKTACEDAVANLGCLTVDVPQSREVVDFMPYKTVTIEAHTGYYVSDTSSRESYTSEAGCRNAIFERARKATRSVNIDYAVMRDRESVREMQMMKH